MITSYTFNAHNEYFVLKNRDGIRVHLNVLGNRRYGTLGSYQTRFNKNKVKMRMTKFNEITRYIIDDSTDDTDVLDCFYTSDDTILKEYGVKPLFTHYGVSFYPVDVIDIIENDTNKLFIMDGNTKGGFISKSVISMTENREFVLLYDSTSIKALGNKYLPTSKVNPARVVKFILGLDLNRDLDFITKDLRDDVESIALVKELLLDKSKRKEELRRIHSLLKVDEEFVNKTLSVFTRLYYTAKKE